MLQQKLSEGWSLFGLCVSVLPSFSIMAAHLLCGLGRLCILSVQAGGNGLTVRVSCPLVLLSTHTHTHKHVTHISIHTHTAVALIYSETKRFSCVHTHTVWYSPAVTPPDSVPALLSV